MNDDIRPIKEALYHMIECFKGIPQTASMGFDSPPEPATQWDYEAFSAIAFAQVALDENIPSLEKALTALGRVEMVLDRDTIETRIIKSLTVQGIKEPYGFSVSDIVTDITGVIRGNPTPPGDAGERNTVTPMEK